MHLKQFGVEDYRDLMSKWFVISTLATPWSTSVMQVLEWTAFLTSLFLEADMDDEDTITFKQWEQAECGANIVLRSETVAIFTEELFWQMELLTSHNFIAKFQAEFLTTSQTTLKHNSVVILLDFAKNYSFLVQATIQGQQVLEQQPSITASLQSTT